MIKKCLLLLISISIFNMNYSCESEGKRSKEFFYIRTKSLDRGTEIPDDWKFTLKFINVKNPKENLTFPHLTLKECLTFPIQLSSFFNLSHFMIINEKYGTKTHNIKIDPGWLYEINVHVPMLLGNVYEGRLAVSYIRPKE